ncbi:MAG: serine/threonine protein kinase [Planctomycetota bacterium]|jgi:tetratricopeptide (TPR) repeat protein
MKSLIGEVVGGCQILAELASGGMGVIYRAKQLSLDREVALKILSDRLSGDPKFAERFLREARAIARANHPNILPVYDVGVDVDLSLHYMIMELIEGRSLAEVLQEKGVLPPKVAADHIRQAAMGLACAQSVAIIHRDVKPENMMVTQQGVVKVSDFGLAKEVDSGSLTATDSVMGTPAYMSPEQCDGKTVDGRTDIYSLGGTFYRLVTGRLPFEAETAMSMMYRHKHEPLTPPRQVVPTVSHALSDVIVKMMAKRREDRYQTMDEVAKAITQALAAPDDGADTQETLQFRAGAQQAAPASGGVAGAVVGGGIAPIDPRRRKLERLIVQGDKRLQHGDLPGAVRLWREAMGIADDPRIRERMEKNALPESEKNKKTAEQRFIEGKLADAERHYRAAVDLNPDDKDAAARLEDIRGKIAKRREAVNQVRQFLASNRLEEAVEVWDGLPEDFRDEAIGRQIRQVRDVVLPVLKLCDQGDAAMKEGDLKRAVSLFRRGVDVDPQSDRAREGLRDAERRLGRIEGMLKEGYQHNVKENYQKAIDAWASVLKIIPDHPQAMKLMIEARLRLGHGHRQKQGSRNQAIAQWREILRLDPGHRTAQALLEEDTSVQESLSAFSEEAQNAFSRRKYGRAVSAWRRMLDIDPGNHRIENAVEQATRLGRKRTLVRLVILLAVLVVGGAGGQFAREYLTLRKAKKLADASDPLNAAITIKIFEGPFVFLAGVKDGRYRVYRYTALIMDANKLAAEGDFETAAERLQEAQRYVSDADRDNLRDLIKRNGIRKQIHDAEILERKKQWYDAIGFYDEAAATAAEANNPKFEKLKGLARKAAEFAGLAQRAVDAERDGDLQLAANRWRVAAEVRPDHWAVKEAFERLGISE